MIEFSNIKPTSFIAALGMLVISVHGGFAEEVTPVITVSGEGSVSVIPDKATLSFGISESAPEAEAAFAAASKKMASIIAVLEDAGFGSDAVQTDQLRLNIERDYSKDKPLITGYNATSTVRLETIEISTLGGLLGDVVSAGVNEINDISFGLQDSEAVRDQALRAAVENAEHQAEIAADAASVELGRIISLQIGSISIPSPVQQGLAMRAMAMDAAPEMKISAGSLDISASVTVQYQIEN